MTPFYGIPDKLPARTPARMPPTYPLPVPKGCVLLYDMLGGGHNKQLDRSPYHYDGALTGTAQTATGRYFDGASFIDMGKEKLGTTGLFCDNTQKFTVLVAAQAATNVTGTLIARASGTTATRTYYMYTDNGNLAIVLRGTPTLIGTQPGKPFVVGTVWDGTTATSRLGRGVTATANVGAAVEEAGQRIIAGARTNGTAVLLTGYEYWLEVYDCALSTAEWQARYDYIKAVLQARGVNLP